MRERGAWLWLALALGAALRVYLLVFTEGTFDVAIKQHHGTQIGRLGLLEYYRQAAVFNHPPLMGEWFAALVWLAEATGIPVAETQAGKGALPFDHPCSLGAIGVTGTASANLIAREADLVIGLGTRYSDFTTASKTAFQNPQVRFININVADFDALKHSALPLVSDARV